MLVSGINRAFSQAAANQLNTSQSSLGQLNALQNYTSQIDNLFGTTAGGFQYGAADLLQRLVGRGGRSDLHGRPSGAWSDAPALAQNLNTTSTQLNNLEFGRQYPDHRRRAADQFDQHPDFRSESTNRREHGQRPGANTLLDQRDQLVSNLSQIAGVTTTSNSDGSINVYVGNGQPLVLDSNTYSLTTVPNQFNASQLKSASSTSNGNSISSSITWAISAGCCRRERRRSIRH